MSFIQTARRSLILTTCLCSTAAFAAGGIDIRDLIIKQWFDATPHNPPAEPEAGVDYGMIGENGAFVAPTTTPLSG